MREFRQADANALASELRRRVHGEIRFDGGTRALYATDGSNYRQVPIGVVFPSSVEDAMEAVAACREFGAPVLSRGCGTSLAGQCCNVAVIIDWSKYINKILEIDPDRKLARIQPGVILDELRDAAENHHLTFGPDPSTHAQCTIGGMIGNNACGVHSVMAGRTADNVETLEILTYDGERMTVGRTSDDELHNIIEAGGRRGDTYARLKMLRDRYADAIRERFVKIPRRVSGYNLDELLPEKGFHVARALVGTESTCITVLEATVRLVHSPPARVLAVLGYSDVYTAADHVPEILSFGPVGFEGVDDGLLTVMRKRGLHLENIALLPEGSGVLLVEFGGETIDEARERAQTMMSALDRAGAPAMKLFEDPREARRVWIVRESGLGATAAVPGESHTWEGWEDSAVAPDRLGDYLRDLRKLMAKYGYRGALYGHFGDGCVHTRNDFDLLTPAGIRKFRAYVDEAADLVVSYGGSLSGEHGDGQSRAELLPKMFGPELVDAFREFKAIWDPGNKMNPGRVVDPHPITADLRLGVDYRPRADKTHFRFPGDGSFAGATLRCVGVGSCRRLSGGTMCPSFMVTREEKHSTRGRARLLFEMIRGNALLNGWHDDTIKDALDLCLACKGCKGDCPTNTDVATYKAEFLAHYYDGRRRPAAAYAMGFVDRWARLGALMPSVANFFTETPVLSDAIKAIGGVAPQRRLPRFASRTFRQWFASRGGRTSAGKSVLLWPDTFTNYFHPETGRAAVEVLEAAGFSVDIPRATLCCGRPLYDWGMLDRAKKQLREITDALGADIEAGTPIIFLEPSCAAVFRDEVLGLYPDAAWAKALGRQSLLLSEFLDREGYQPLRLSGKALVHGHCHHKAIMKMTAEETLLKRTGLEFTILDSGCCGMAGAFGFEKRHYDISVKIGERVLLPAVRAADKNTLIIADGFSCREQIGQLSGRRALHLAEVLRLAMHQNGLA